MKKSIVIAALLLMMPAVCSAAAAISTGNAKLDKYLNGLNEDVAEGKLSVADLKAHIEKSFGLKESDHVYMKKKGLTPAEHYLVGLIHKETKASVRRIVSLRRGGKKKWSDVIYYLGATPDELNAERVADAKKWKKGKRKAKKTKAAASPSADEKGMTIKEDGDVWDCRCRLKSKRRK
jgi:hypothetical protein